MSPMLEKVARAICLAAGLEPDRKFKSSNYGPETAPHEFAWHEFLPEARAALLAIGEGGAATEARLLEQVGDLNAVGFTDVIDAILGDDKP